MLDAYRHSRQNLFSSSRLPGLLLASVLGGFGVAGCPADEVATQSEIDAQPPAGACAVPERRADSSSTTGGKADDWNGTRLGNPFWRCGGCDFVATENDLPGLPDWAYDPSVSAASKAEGRRRFNRWADRQPNWDGTQFGRYVYTLKSVVPLATGRDLIAVYVQTDHPDGSNTLYWRSDIILLDAMSELKGFIPGAYEKALSGGQVLLSMLGTSPSGGFYSQTMGYSATYNTATLKLLSSRGKVLWETAIPGVLPSYALRSPEDVHTPKPTSITELGKDYLFMPTDFNGLRRGGAKSSVQVIDVQTGDITVATARLD